MFEFESELNSVKTTSGEQVTRLYTVDPRLSACAPRDEYSCLCAAVFTR